MSYSSYSGYHDSSVTPSNSNTRTHSSGRNSDGRGYPSHLNNSSNTQQMNYNSSSYNYPNAPSYTDTNNVGTSTGAWRQDVQSVNYGYQRNSTYANRETTAGEAYTSSSYPRSNLGQSPPQSHAHGLNNLAYASELGTADSRATNAQASQRYEGGSQSSYSQQETMRSPIASQSRYTLNPPSVAASYPMQPQNSSSPTSSQQQTMNAGAVNRRYPPTSHNASNSSNINSVRQGNKLSASNQPSRISSPLVDNSSGYQRITGKNTQQASQTVNSPHMQTVNQEAQATPRSDSSLYRANAQQISSNQVHRPQQSANSITSILSTTQNVEQGSDLADSGVAENVTTFVDPARVFNPYHREHEMKRLQAEAEAKRKAEEQAKAEELRKQNEAAEQDTKRKAAQEAKAEEARRKTEKADQDAKQRQAKAQATKKSAKGNAKSVMTGATPPDETPISTELDEQAAMAAEMKAMMEKMKAFRSRDPAFFQKMWEDIRKPAYNVDVNSIQSPSPQLAAQSLPAGHGSTAQHTSRLAQSPTTTPKAQTQPRTTQESPNSAQSAAKNGYKVVVENNAEGLPDLGRFPAERRIRNPGYNKREKPNNFNTPGILEGPAGEFAPFSKVASDGSPLPPASATPAALSNIFPPATADSVEGASGAKPANKQQSNGTLWPVEKRTALITTALKVLKANPQNADIVLTEQEFRDMLSSDPSYIGLCEMLEKRGLLFHRNVFARDLLNSVPELESAASKAKATPPSTNKQTQFVGPVSVPVVGQPPAPPPHQQKQQPLPPPPPQSQYPPIAYNPRYGPPQGCYAPLYPHAHPPPPHHQQQYQHPMQVAQPITFPTQAPHMPLQPPGPGHMPFQPPQGTLSRLQPIPGTKEAAARKRDFSELIDLTELGENEDYVMPSKHARLDEPHSDTEMEKDPFKAFQAPSNVQMNPAYVKPAIQRGLSFPPALIPRAVPLNGSTEPSTRMLLAKPLNKDEALKKIYYDPKTVARDILIATGRHPSERPLNVHLAGMLGKYIELESDVSSFDWDEIDPGGPPAPKIEFIDLPASKPRFRLGERVPRKRGPTKPKLFTVEKMRLPNLDKRVNDPFVNAQNAVNPQPLPASSPQHHFQPKASDKKSSLLRNSLLASEQDGLATPSLHDPTILNSASKTPSRPQTMKLVDKQTPVAKRRTSLQEMESTHRKRGRPPGSKNKFPTVAGLKEQAIKVNVPRRDTVPLKEKEKFKCKWKSCNIVLINLDTLRKHIGKVHRPSEQQISREGYTCWWKRCKYLAQDEEGGWITTHAFDDWEEWLSHIERDHVYPIAMKYGDGPPTQHIDPLEIQQDRQRYLSTLDLRPDGTEYFVETTPLISAEHNASHPPDVLNLTRVHPNNTEDVRAEAEVEALRYFMQAHKIMRKSREASEQVIRAMEKRREKIGPGMDRGGCTLITEDMRDTFVQNPAIRRVIKNDA